MSCNSRSGRRRRDSELDVVLYAGEYNMLNKKQKHTHTQDDNNIFTILSPYVCVVVVCTYVIILCDYNIKYNIIMRINGHEPQG